MFVKNTIVQECLHNAIYNSNNNNNNNCLKSNIQCTQRYEFSGLSTSNTVIGYKLAILNKILTLICLKMI